MHPNWSNMGGPVDTDVQGTFGYLTLWTISWGHLTEKSDVYNLDSLFVVLVYEEAHFLLIPRRSWSCQTFCYPTPEKQLNPGSQGGKQRSYWCHPVGGNVKFLDPERPTMRWEGAQRHACSQRSVLQVTCWMMMNRNLIQANDPSVVGISS